jgi:hypothetical protein
MQYKVISYLMNEFFQMYGERKTKFAVKRNVFLLKVNIAGQCNFVIIPFYRGGPMGEP